MQDNKKEQFKNLIFLDVEATGLEEYDRLVQVAYNYQGIEREEKFKTDAKMCVRAMEVTNITDKQLENQPIFQGSDFYSDLAEILIQEETILVAHNANYDIKMLERENLKVGKFIDTLKIAKFLDVQGEIPAYRLQYLRYHFMLEVGEALAHDALGDVQVLKVLFEKMYNEMLAEGLSSAEVLEKMIKISSEPVLIKRFNFGKYKDKLVSEVARENRGYLEWLLQQKEFAAKNGDEDEDWIFTLRKYLD
jgi:DNA polymerase III alpha subunit (gram-positive type)